MPKARSKAGQWEKIKQQMDEAATLVNRLSDLLYEIEQLANPKAKCKAAEIDE